MLRKGKYKYHYYVGYRPELFDLKADPEELHDLAEMAYKPVLAKASANVSIPKPSMLKRKRRKPPLSNATAVPIRPETSALPARHRCRAMVRNKSL